MIDRMQGVVTFPVTCAITAASSVSGPMEPVLRDIEFTYRDSRSLEVEMYIVGAYTPRGKENRWFFHRDIIIDGVAPNGHSGIGDVKVSNDDEFCFIRLSSQDGWCVLRFSLALMREFVRQMTELVPLGREHINMDLVIAKIFKEDAR